jgi:4-amino-4-deoxy-L-arabinose transferase-like glycosyltransferase
LNSTKSIIIILIGIVLVYLIGLPIDVMEVDAAQYATISYEMFESQEYLQVYCRGYDYLDKPPFLFWINQVFFQIFGVHDWSFKIGSLLFILLGIYSTFQLGKCLYNKNAGLMASVILASTQAWFLMSQDVKTDGILASIIIFTVWQWKVFTINKKWIHIIGMSVGIGIGMLTKGPLGLVVPVVIMGIDLLIHRNWKMIFSWKYIIAILIIAGAISPMLYGLYLQYDLHPGKIVSGGQMVDSGIKFYFWTQSFGRITGESTWNNHTSYFYFIPEIAWAFLPWSIFIIQAFIFSIRTQVKNNIIPVVGFIFPLLALSLSHFKLSHYIFICFPFIALMVGNYLVQNPPKLLAKILGYGLQIIILIAIPLLGYCFQIPWLYTSLLIIFVITVGAIIQRKFQTKLYYSILLSGIALNFFLNLFIYPSLVKYQSQSIAGKIYADRVPEKNIPLIEINTWSFSTEFYAQTKVGNYAALQHMQDVEKEGIYWIYMPHATYLEMDKTNFTVIETIILDNYPITRLKLGFINPTTRNNFISKTYLLKVYMPEDWKI